MQLKEMMQKFVYRIEAKPGGGFIARALDPAVPPLEAPTREELQRMIQAKVLSGLGESFPALKIPVQSGQHTLELHIDRKVDGNFSVQSHEVGGAEMDPATQEKIDHYAEEILGFVSKHFPHLSEKIAEQVREAALNAAQGQTTTLAGQSVPQQPSGPYISGPNAQTDVKVERTTLNNAVVLNTPITPEAGGSKGVLLVIAGLLALAGLYYFLYYR
jgi:hypothetical protein